MPDVLIRFARVSLESFGRIDDAAEACKLAFQQGYQSRELVVVYCACAMLDGALDAAEGTLRSARVLLSPAAGAALEREILDLVVQAGRVIAGGTSEPALKPPPKAVEREEPQTPKQPPKGAALAPSEPTMPHLNTRFYVDEGMFSIDYYDNVVEEGYIDRFVSAFRRAERDGRMQFAGSLMRSTPFYFTICPGCGVCILSNRDVGKSITCHMCERRHDTKVATDAPLRELLKQVEQAVGRPVVDLSGRKHLVLLQAVNPADQEKIAPICREFGFDELNATGPAAGPLLSTGVERRLIDPSRPSSLWSIKAGTGTTTQGEETPPEVERLLRRLRSDVGAIGSLSMSYYADADDLYTHMIEGRHDKIEAAAREQIARAPADIAAWQALVFILLQTEQVESAIAEAEKFTSALPDDAESWGMLGVALTKARRYADAVPPLRTAFELDPTSRTAAMVLEQCLRELGNEKEAAEVFARMQSLGGIT
jgi:tetratricopeptide (TPR) repeat protein